MTRWVCFNELDVPARTVPGISGTAAHSGGAVELYWRRIVKRKHFGASPWSTGTDDPDAAYNWVAVYRRATADECINYQSARTSVMVVAIYETRDLARHIASALG